MYVGKQAFTHYDFSNYEDFDRDYAFVTVYNGVSVAGSGGGWKQVSKAEYDAFQGDKEIKSVTLDEETWKKEAAQYGEAPVGPYFKDQVKGERLPVGHDYQPKAGETLFPLGKEVDSYTYEKATKLAKPYNNGQRCEGQCPIEVDGKLKLDTSEDPIAITEAEYKELAAKKAKGEYLGKLEAKDGSWYKTQYWVVQWYAIKDDYVVYKKITGYFIKEPFAVTIKDVGRLGDNVGGQGFAWNQPTGKYVRTFGYPYAKHPDGSKPYSGVTPKWCYGKTGAKATKVASLKIEEHVALKCAVTGGYNGAPWLLKYSNAKRMGYVNGVTSVLYDTDSNDRWDYMSTPYFDGETAAVYTAAANVWSGSIIPKADS
ncbi:trypsin-like serine peptidase [Nonomuraea antri]|uniref:hypothetical protein n=1 Tax=Nonomuraea antri TaxID=2730852 RepID=UPI0038B26E17